MKTRSLILCLALSFMSSLSFAGNKKDITIIFENDAHSTLSGYAKMVTVKNQALKETKNVLTCCCGDFSTDFIPTPGLGRNTEGAGIIEVMNVVGYDFVEPGNHDFDFTIPTLQKNMSNLKAGVVCCNAINTKTGESIFPAYMIKKIGGKKVAFVGVITPTTISRRNQKNFSDEQGNVIYSFMGDAIIETVQKNVDKARAEGADLVIVLSHLGDKANGYPTSIDLIKGTNGIDLVLDGHAHTVIEGDKYENKDGKQILLTSTGLKFANIGKVTISKKGVISSALIPVDSIEADAAAQAAIDKINAKYMSENK
ncbi:MAG: CapA family protein [Bacteroidia bacterium]|nr:CapA family protein [Bacteroidia bacterium]